VPGEWLYLWLFPGFQEFIIKLRDVQKAAMKINISHKFSNSIMNINISCIYPSLKYRHQFYKIDTAHLLH
jgi:hypothetical protein